MGTINVSPDEVRIFVRVVEARSFSAAARGLGLPKSTVSRKVAALEERLDVRLLQRTTRSLSLTDEGAAYYERAARALADLDEASEAAAGTRVEPRGLVKVTAPVDLGARFVAPVTAEFCRLHPAVRVRLELTERVVDLVAEGCDVAIRAGRLDDSSLIARRLGPARWVLCASRAYLQRAGTPRRLEDLKGHEAVAFQAPASGAAWRLRNGSRYVRIPVHPRFASNHAESVRSATLAGLGIAFVPEAIVAVDLASGRLRRVLEGHEPPETDVHVVYPGGRFLPARVRAFVDLLVARFTPPPWLQPQRAARG